MTRSIVRHRVLLAACALALLLSSSLGRSEIAETGEPEPRPSPEALAIVPPADVALRTQCWQDGVKIIDQVGLHALSLNDFNKENAVSFKRQVQNPPSVFIVPFPDGLCLVQPQP